MLLYSPEISSPAKTFRLLNMASKNVCIPCGARVYRCLQHLAMHTSSASNNNTVASRETEAFLASAMYWKRSNHGGAKRGNGNSAL